MASILVHLPEGTALVDPDPGLTEKRDVSLVDVWDDSVIGAVGWSSGGMAAIRSALEHPELERLAIVSTPFEEDLVADVDLGSITVKTLLLFGSADAATGSRHGRAWKQQLPNARLEMVPKAGHDLLGPIWARILSHLAPKRIR